MCDCVNLPGNHKNKRVLTTPVELRTRIQVMCLFYKMYFHRNEMKLLEQSSQFFAELKVMSFYTYFHACSGEMVEGYMAAVDLQMLVPFGFH